VQPSETYRSQCGSVPLSHGRRVPGIVQGLASVVFFTALHGSAQTIRWSVRIANTLTANASQSGDHGAAKEWSGETGLELEGLSAAWYNTANGDYFRFVRKTVDAYLDAHSSGANANPLLAAENDPLLADQILLLYRVTLAPRYFDAASTMQHQLTAHCVDTSADTPAPGAAKELPKAPCDAQPFLAEYASVFHQPQDFALITRSFTNWEERVAASPTSRPSSVDLGDRNSSAPWLASAVVDSLPNYPDEDPGHAELIALFNRLAAAAVRQQNRQTGLFEDRPEGQAHGPRPQSTTTSCLLVYALEKGVRLGYLPERYAAPAHRAWQGILRYSVRVDEVGSVVLSTPSTQFPSSAASPDHAGIKELAAFLLAATEEDHESNATLGHGATVTLDAWYNSQRRKNAAGQVDDFHYKWTDWSDSGYSLLGHIFRSFGANTATLPSEPTVEKLAKSKFYIIASPDIPVKNPDPHYVTNQDAGEIAAWVKRGGVLILFENDPPNADIAHLNLLADQFGIHFDDVLHHHILGERVEDGRIPVSADGKLFHHGHTLYMKDTCAISLREPAVALLRDRGDIVMATTKFGRGTVFAVVDPWLYNEYTDGRKNPLIYNQFDNFAAGKELVQWLLQQRLH
jgi:unsaturated rhamnogalacturonyl hydrolase